MKKLEFETSKRLKTIFNESFDRWRKRNGAGLDELARRCGVSQAYLAHVGRYGRVPGKPVLYLLALNLEIDNPATILDAAGLNEDWPYSPGIGLNPKNMESSGLLSVRLDMNGFTDAVRTIIRSESKQRGIKDLVG